MDAPKSPIDDLLGTVNQAIEEWKQKNDPAAVKKKVQTRLDKESETVVMKLLGFDSRYGDGWSLDHCNGRAGNSAAGDYLISVRGAEIKAWLQDVLMPVIPETVKKKLQKDAKEYIERVIRSQFQTELEKRITVAINNTLDEMCIPKQVDKFLKVQQLIGGSDDTGSQTHHP